MLYLAENVILSVQLQVVLEFLSLRGSKSKRCTFLRRVNFHLMISKSEIRITSLHTVGEKKWLNFYLHPLVILCRKYS